MGGPQWTDEDFQRARIEAARLLGFTNAENLSAADNLKVDLVTSLRAVVDDASASVLEGTQTDLGKLVVAVEHLTKLLPQNQEPASRGADPRTHMWAVYSEMRRKGALAGEGLDGAKLRIERLTAEIAAKDAEIERLKAGGAAPGEPGASTGTFVPVGDNVVPMPRSSASSGASAQPPKPATGLLTDDEPQPWRPFVGGGSRRDPWADNRT